MVFFFSPSSPTTFYRVSTIKKMHGFSRMGLPTTIVLRTTSVGNPLVEISHDKSIVWKSLGAVRNSGLERIGGGSGSWEWHCAQLGVRSAPGQDNQAGNVLAASPYTKL